MTEQKWVPKIILHIPHSSTTIPPELREDLQLSNDELHDELLRMTDAYTDELFSPPDDRILAVTYGVSRLVVDPERFPDDEQEPMAQKGMGAVYTRTSRCTPLRSQPTAEQRALMLERFYWPHHRQLELAVTNTLQTHGSALIIDCHSFPATPSPYEMHQSPDRPDICIGTDAYHTPPALTESLVDFFRSKNLSVSLDVPFAGSLVPLRYYGKEHAVNSIMIELNRGLYMDLKTGERSAGFARLKDDIGEALTLLVNHATDCLPP